jgi:hypothetical protein
MPVIADTNCGFRISVGVISTRPTIARIKRRSLVERARVPRARALRSARA